MNLLPRLKTRTTLLIAATIVFVATVFLFAGPSAFQAMLVICSDGVFAMLWIAGACALGDVCLPTTNVTPPLRVATAGGIGLGIFSLLGLGLGLIGALNRPVAIALPVAGAVLWTARMLWRHRRWLASSPSLSFDPVKRWLAQPAGMEWLWLIPVLSLSMACVGAAVLPGLLWKPLDPHPYDVVSYHLQVPREWFEMGRIVPLHHNVFSYFPFNVEMQFLLAMHATGGPWAGMYVCQFLNVWMTALMLLAIAGAGRGGTVAAAIVSAVPWVTMLACVAYVETGFLLYSTLALIWALRGMGGTPVLRAVNKSFLLAGIFAGLAAGVKITAVPMLIVPIAIGLPILQWRKVSAKSIALGMMTFIIAAGVVLSPWLIRNVLWAGNPIFPLAMNLLGRAHFSIEQVERFRVAHSPRPDQAGLGVRLRILFSQVFFHWQFAAVLLPAGLIMLLRRTRYSAFLAINAVVVLVVWLEFTHLLPRFAVSLIPLAGLAFAAFEFDRWKPAGVIVAGMVSVFGFAATGSTLYEQIAPIASNQLFGVVKLNFETLQDVQKLDPTDFKSVALIGDAAAFLVQVPMDRLRYRCVFDLPADAADPIDAWAGAGVRGNPGWLLAVNPAEIDRLHKTYLHVPALPASLATPSNEPYVIPATNVP